MKIALKYAKESFNNNEVPVGAIIVKDNEIISFGQNRRESDKNSLAHAEIEAINNACKKLNTWRLINCDIYVTLEPCPMCAGAIVNSRINKVYFGAYDDKYGCCGSNINVLNLENSYHPKFEGGILEDECKSIISDFFKNLRKNK